VPEAFDGLRPFLWLRRFYVSCLMFNVLKRNVILNSFQDLIPFLCFIVFVPSAFDGLAPVSMPAAFLCFTFLDLMIRRFEYLKNTSEQLET